MLFGSLVVITAAWPEGVEYLVTIRFLRAAWVVALIGTVLFTGFAAAAVTPDGGGSPFNPSTWLDLVDAGWAGRAVLLRLVFLDRVGVGGVPPGARSSTRRRSSPRSASPACAPR